MISFMFTNICINITIRKACFSLTKEEKLLVIPSKLLKNIAERMRRKFFSLMINGVWNKLPSNIVNSEALNSFKARLYALFGDKKYSCSKDDIISCA